MPKLVPRKVHSTKLQSGMQNLEQQAVYNQERVWASKYKSSTFSMRKENPLEGGSLAAFHKNS